MKSLLISLIILIGLYCLHTKYFAKHDNFDLLLKKERNNEISFVKNEHIVEVLDSMKYIIRYNNDLYYELRHTVNSILVSYYKFINGKIHIDDISFHKSKLLDLYEELTLALPYKYYKRLKKHMNQINKELDKKMDLIKLQSVKNPIKLSLMNSNKK